MSEKLASHMASAKSVSL